MFGVIGKKITETELPQPPSAEEILQDLEISGPDDVVFTTDIAQLNGEIQQASALQGSLQLQKRFEVRIYFIFFYYRENGTKLMCFEL